MAAVGALLISSGIALMAATAPATAGNDHQVHKSYVCKYVGQPGAETEVLQTGQNPIWVDNHSLTKDKDATVSVGDVFADAQGYSKVIVANTPKLDPEPTCPGQQTLLPATAKADPVPATCAANVPSYSTAGSVGVASWTESAAPAFGTTITLTAHAAPGYAFGQALDQATTTVPVTFGTAATGCTAVSPPVVSPPTKHHAQVKAKAKTPTVVEAGLASATTSSGAPVAEGLALVAAGLLMMAGAGGMVLRRGGDAR